MFVGSISVKPSRDLTRPLGMPRGLKGLLHVLNVISFLVVYISFLVVYIMVERAVADCVYFYVLSFIRLFPYYP
jgi:hypothetical protein